MDKADLYGIFAREPLLTFHPENKHLNAAHLLTPLLSDEIIALARTVIRDPGALQQQQRESFQDEGEIIARDGEGHSVPQQVCTGSRLHDSWSYIDVKLA